MAYPLSQIPRCCISPHPDQLSLREERILALKEITRLLELLTEQEKKYEDRLSPHSNFYCQHVMVQQFIQIQLKTEPSPTKKKISLNIARSFGRRYGIGRNIV